MNNTIEKSDVHYRDIENSGDPEPIVIQESLMDRLVKAGVPTRRALDIVMGQKHISRAGVKKGEDWSKEIQKAINYLTRGLTGEWIKD